MTSAVEWSADGRAALATALGELVMSGSYLEVTAFLVARSVSGVGEPAARAVFDRSNLEALLSTIDRLTQVAGKAKGKTHAAALQEWLRAAKKAAATRNQMVHAMWVGGGGASPAGRPCSGTRPASGSRAGP